MSKGESEESFFQRHHVRVMRKQEETSGFPVPYWGLRPPFWRSLNNKREGTT
ncbi:hypothetical protein [Mesorhizobium captivum]|uniref:hypothetical protein n=1 Tax=Mesorhizobium captivum TaxID=3072319 RepID=UPI002A240A2C|nr:hypothetical protein [Mesorhizobium sp. VK22E]